jgi:F-type H+-transporting ATPase subunit delta
MPAPSGSARRYAQALFDLANGRNALDQWSTQLKQVSAVVSNPQVARVIMAPALSIAKKRDAVLAVTGPIDRELQVLINMLLERKRLDLVPRISEAFENLLRKHRGVEQVELISAVELTAEERELVGRRLATQLGKTVTITNRIDPAIMGGLVVRVGDRMLDASVRGKLEALRKRLATVR